MPCLPSQISTATSMKEKMAKKGSRELFLMCSPFQAAVSLQELPTLIQKLHFSPGAVQPKTKLHPVKRTSASQVYSRYRDRGRQILFPLLIMGNEPKILRKPTEGYLRNYERS